MASMSDSNTNPNTTNNVHVSLDASNAALVPVGRKRKSNDIGWEFGILIDEKNPDKVQCTLCKKVFFGGVNRLKEHVANIVGNVVPCRKASKDNQLRCRQVIMDAKNKKKNKKKEVEEVKVDVSIGGEEDLEEIGLPRKTSKLLGPMDEFANPTLIPHYLERLLSKSPSAIPSLSRGPMILKDMWPNGCIKQAFLLLSLIMTVSCKW
ncbi:hypothetical protein Ddye_013916 [Dipteronia dyeriana]|uniref:BED-type domain-containing protein n=1 Tax=Dipteronia dyeriana TaxID=168575 RepID=A0AAD9X739_9ROSI|nr:hypothetical protein Ddye_013916 [Dipteronia dyeriana]